MNGFWAGGVPPWGIVACSAVCVLFLLAGIWVGQGRRDRAYEDGYDACLEDERDRRQARRRLLELEVVHEWRPDSQVRTAATEPGWLGSTPTTSLPSPLALTRGDPITTGEIAAITPRMEKFLEELFAVPYSADELWSGQ